MFAVYAASTSGATRNPKENGESKMMINKHLPLTRKQYLFLSFTWGIIQTVIGVIALAAFASAGYPIERNRHGWLIRAGTGWGGISFGPVAIVSRTANDYVEAHEFGHSIQNCYYGPFALVLVSIPSVIRYWIFKLKRTNIDYYSIWFEKEASELGGLY